MTDDNLVLPPDFCGQVRLFPLSNLVLFPGNVLPLHIFESRYEEMLEDATPRRPVGCHGDAYARFRARLLQSPLRVARSLYWPRDGASRKSDPGHVPT